MWLPILFEYISEIVHYEIFLFLSFFIPLTVHGKRNLKFYGTLRQNLSKRPRVSVLIEIFEENEATFNPFPPK